MKRISTRGITEKKTDSGVSTPRRAHAPHLRAQQNALYALSAHKAFERADSAEMFPVFTETGARILDVERASVWLYADDRSRIRCMDLFESGSRRHSGGTELAVAEYPSYFQALEAGIAVVASDA